VEIPVSVPPFSTRVLTEVELRPEKVKQSLADLPLLNTAETGRKLFSTLSIYNRIAIEPATRLELLEMLRYPIRQITTELEKQFVGPPLPLAEKQKTIAEQCRQFHLEMAIGYKRYLIDAELPERAREQERFRGKAALATQRALRHLTGALLVSYQGYSPYPLGTWQEIHALYRHSETLGTKDLLLSDPEIRALPETSVSHAYKQALLLDLSDPYHLPVMMIGRIHQYLDRWAGLAKVLPPTEQFDPACQFLIDQQVDRSGIIYTADAELERPEHYRLLNTVELARRIHSHLTALQNAQEIPADGLSKDFFAASDEAQNLLVRLIQSFGHHPKRNFRRSTRAGTTKVEVALGLNAVNYWINGGAAFVVSSTFVGPNPQRGQISATKQRRQDVHVPDLEFSSWDVMDESAGGLALGKKGHIVARVRVGEIAAVRPAGDRAWRIGVIRWVKSPSSSSLEFGVQWIAASAQAVVVKVVTDEGKESDFLPALLLPEIPGLKQAASLVTARGIYKPDRVFYLDNGFRLYRVRITKPDEISHSFERFQFSMDAM
jgi:hypothetical protein